ncbi:cold-shock DNA-binding protein family [Streptomyces zhaozhouensis]|uniref:Cold-shock DNA-binding protein family n=1 Tax=Streptomyces zhaozhouensis TaxID=1300267 RepID=A0A286DSR0_9ACTN|nr:cold shock domain-containing protein [Streptomyces zhaozhouensis]SOD61712.1 cold-shock DNA-binding protein family [Streptomyces zhaozhouensis]
MTQGRVVRFDDIRGYGFIIPDEGGEDVFMHANDLLDDKHLYQPGTVVEFDVAEGERGPKASLVSVVKKGAAAPAETSAPAAAAARAEPTAAGVVEDGLCDVLSPREFRQELTETLLEGVPSLTAAQILQVRQGVERLARGHGWLAS